MLRFDGIGSGLGFWFIQADQFEQFLEPGQFDRCGIARATRAARAEFFRLVVFWIGIMVATVVVVAFIMMAFIRIATA